MLSTESLVIRWVKNLLVKRRIEGVNTPAAEPISLSAEGVRAQTLSSLGDEFAQCNGKYFSEGLSQRGEDRSFFAEPEMTTSTVKDARNDKFTSHDTIKNDVGISAQH